MNSDKEDGTNMSELNVCELCGRPLHDEDSTADISIASRYDGDVRFDQTRSMKVHVNCAVDAKNAVLALRDRYGFFERTVAECLGTKKQNVW